MEHRYSSTQNNGQITQQKDWISGQEVSYQYDALKRPASAATTSSAWGLSYTYDGWGNRLSQTVTKGSGPTSSLNYSGLTNRITMSGFSYDANGNLTQMPGSGTFTYDVANRRAGSALR
jgi:YD repeat-containing protein